MKKELQKILYVEDEPEIQEIATMALEHIGNFTVCECCSGKEALEKIEEFDPDLVLTDVMMPEIDGAVLFRKIRQIPKYRNMPIIFMTAKAQNHEIEKYYEIGALDVIVKPFKPVSLSDEIKKAWDRFDYKEETIL